MLFAIGSLVSFSIFVYFGNVLILMENINHVENNKTESCSISERSALTKNQVQFNDDNQLTVNDEVVLTVRPGSANYRFLRYMFENSNKAVPISMIYEHTGIDSNVYINKLVCNTHIPKEIRQHMFKIDNGYVTLNTMYRTYSV